MILFIIWIIGFYPEAYIKVIELYEAIILNLSLFVLQTGCNLYFQCKSFLPLSTLIWRHLYFFYLVWSSSQVLYSKCMNSHYLTALFLFLKHNTTSLLVVPFQEGRMSWRVKLSRVGWPLGMLQNSVSVPCQPIVSPRPVPSSATPSALGDNAPSAILAAPPPVVAFSAPSPPETIPPTESSTLRTVTNSLPVRHIYFVRLPKLSYQLYSIQNKNMYVRVSEWIWMRNLLID